MAATRTARKRAISPFRRWFFEGQLREVEGPYEREREHPQHAWWQVMCLTGVDYFSTLGYQPGIAAVAAGALSPIATLILVLLTLFGALPIYRKVAAESPHGEGSIAMLEHLLSRWTGKLFVLVLLGFVATDFVITMTLSAADATAHLIENPFAPAALQGQQVAVTLALIALLGAIFLKGFKEAIGLAVALVFSYLALNAVVIGVALLHVAQHPHFVAGWQHRLFEHHSNPMMMVAISLLLFPRLALGMSGFETGVAVMPLVRGKPGDDPAHPAGRIANTRKLLFTAALVMSVFLITSSFATIALIPPHAFREGGKASGRALAYLAHALLGDTFGTVYDVSTILILWFAGASAMAGLLNIVPRYLPRYGMAPDWTRAVRPLVVVFTVIAFVVTLVFHADVEAQGGAYATGVLVLMSSGAVAVALSAWRTMPRLRASGFVLIALVFFYTTIVNIIERPEGIKIASLFIAAIIITSLISRVWRTTELRVDRIEVDDEARRFITEARAAGKLRIIANRRQAGDAREYDLKEREMRDVHRIPPQNPILFLEVDVRDASEFAGVMHVGGVEIGRHRVLRARSSVVPNAIAAFLLYLRDVSGDCPAVYFSWSEGNPLIYLLSYVAFGEGDTAPVTHEVLRQAEPDPHRRPEVYVGG